MIFLGFFFFFCLLRKLLSLTNSVFRQPPFLMKAQKMHISLPQVTKLLPVKTPSALLPASRDTHKSKSSNRGSPSTRLPSGWCQQPLTGCRMPLGWCLYDQTGLQAVLHIKHEAKLWWHPCLPWGWASSYKPQEITACARLDVIFKPYKQSSKAVWIHSAIHTHSSTAGSGLGTYLAQ